MSMLGKVNFWGVRGSLPCSGKDFLVYGGNTSCVSLSLGEQLLIFDAGSGLRVLGQMPISWSSREIHMFFTHFHLDHLSGFPFFAPLFLEDTVLHCWSGRMGGQSLQQTLDVFFSPPFFPVTTDLFVAKLQMYEIDERCSWTQGACQISTIGLNHPGGAIGYRVVWQDRVFCYITDVEHTLGQMDQRLIDFIRESDVFVYDAMYTDAEYLEHQGWGHSTWQQGMRLARAAGVKQYIAFHHAPTHTDTDLDGIQTQLDLVMPGALLAKEGMCLTL
ncbi:MAG: MBL fold metallo-hydrolase [Myxococcota bacterium]